MDQFSQTRDTREMTIIAQLISKLIEMTKLIILKPLKADIIQNIDKINTNIIKDAKSKTIDQLQQENSVEIKDIINNSVRQNEGVVWLAFSFNFMAQFLNYLLDDTQTVRNAAQLAYNDVLEQHHNAVQKGLFKTGFLTLPTREDFCQKTGLVITTELKDIFSQYKIKSDQICNEIIHMSKTQW